MVLSNISFPADIAGFIRLAPSTAINALTAMGSLKEEASPLGESCDAIRFLPEESMNHPQLTIQNRFSGGRRD